MKTSICSESLMILFSYDFAINNKAPNINAKTKEQFSQTESQRLGQVSDLGIEKNAPWCQHSTHINLHHVQYIYVHNTMEGPQLL